MNPEDLCTAVREALDETERLARRADGGQPWRLDAGAEYGPEVVVGDDEDACWRREVNDQVWHCDDEQDGCPETARGWIAEGAHIARHDPSSVLRRVAADRRVLDRHQPDDAQCCIYETDDRVQPWPCQDFLDLADRCGITVTEDQKWGFNEEETPDDSA